MPDRDASDVKLELKLAFWENAGKSLHNDNLTAARVALHVKVGEGSIRKSDGDYWIEDVVKAFPRVVPGSLAEVHHKQTDTSKVVKVWRPKLGHKLGPHEYAVLQVVNELWPGGRLNHKAAVRDDLINEKLGRSRVSTRTIERTLKKIRLG